MVRCAREKRVGLDVPDTHDTLAAMTRPVLGRVLVALAALSGAVFGTLFHATPTPAQDGSPTDAPSGTLIYTTAATCPAGWNAAAFVQGRLVVGTDVAANVGTAVGSPMLPDEAPTHRHSVTMDVVVGGKKLQHFLGAGTNVGTAGTYNVTGDTSVSHSGAPLHQLLACRKP